MTENNSQALDHMREHYQSLNNLQHEQLIALRKENHDLRLKITSDQQRKMVKREEYEEKLDQLQILAHDASIRLNEGSEVIRKLQHHLKMCQEKLSDKKKRLLAKDNKLHDYQSHIDQLNEVIRQLMDEKKQLIDEHTAQHLRHSLKFNEHHQIDVAIQTSPTLVNQRRTVRFNLDKENCRMDSKYFPPTNNQTK